MKPLLPVEGTEMVRLLLRLELRKSLRFIA